MIKIGIAFSFQKSKKIPFNSTDVKLDYILTEKGILYVKFLILGDIVGNPGQLALNKNLKELIQKNQIDLRL